MELLGHTLDLIGKILISYTAIVVHYRFRKEHKIDEKVFTEMKKEQVIGVLGIVLMIVGYVLQIPFRL